MNANFSFHRVGLLLCKDWIEYRKKIMYMELIIIAALLIVSMPSALGERIFHPFPFYVFGLLGTLLGYCRYANQVIHRPKGLYLTLPASTFEKYVALLTEGVFCFIAFLVSFWIGIGIGSLFFTTKHIALQDLMVDVRFFAILSFVSSTLFLSHIAFRKYAPGIMLGGYVLVFFSFLGIFYLCKGFLFPFEGCFFYDIWSPFFVTLSWIGYGFAPVSLMATMVVLYVTYLKLKEKELR